MTDGTLSSYVFFVSVLIFKTLNSPVISPLSTRLFPHFPPTPLLSPLLLFCLLICRIIFSLCLPNPLRLDLTNTQQLQMRFAVRGGQLRRRPSPSRRHRHKTLRALFTDAHGYAICFHGDAGFHVACGPPSNIRTNRGSSFSWPSGTEPTVFPPGPTAGDGTRRDA